MALRRILRMLLFFGFVFMAGGSYSFFHTRQFLRTAVRVPGTVVQNIWEESGGRSRSMVAYPQVRFVKSDGEVVVFQSNSGASPPSYQPNDTVGVVYDPGDPHHASIDSFGSLWGLSLGFTLMGLGFCVPQLIFTVRQRAGARKEDWLQQNGRRVQADLMEVALNTSLTVNGVHPYRIVCQWLDPVTNQMHVFHSANIYYDPSKYLPGKTLEVLLDPDNPRRYAVETSFLPKAD